MGFYQNLKDEAWFRWQARALKKAGVFVEALGTYGDKPTQNLAAILGRLPKTYEQAARAYLNHDAISGSLDTRCISAASVPIRYYKRSSIDKGPGNWQLSDAPLARSLRIVNPMSGPMLLWATAYYHLGLGGDSYWKFDGTGWVWSLRPDRTEVISDDSGLPKSYKFTINNGEQYFKADEVLHIKNFHPLSDHYGASPTLSMALGIESDFFMMNYQRDFFRNDSVPRLLLVATRTMGEKNRERFLGMWRKKYGGIGRARGSALIENNEVSVNILADNMRDSDFMQGRKINRQNFQSRLGTPQTVMAEPAANYATARQQNETFWLGTALTLIAWALDQFNSWDRAEAEDVVAIPDIWAHPQIRQILLQRLKDSVPLITNGIMYINEVRAGYGLSPVSWGDDWHRPSNLYGGDNVPPVAEPAKIIEAETKLLSPPKTQDDRYEIRRAKWKVFDRRARKFEKEWIKFWQPEYERQRDKAIKALPDALSGFDLEKLQADIKQAFELCIKDNPELAGGGEKTKAIVLQYALEEYGQKADDSITSVLGAIFDVKGETNIFETLAEDEGLYEGMVGESGEAGYAEVGTPGTFDISDENTLKFIKEKRIEFATDVNDTTRDKLKSLLTTKIDEGASIQVIQDGVRNIFAQVDTAKAYRARTIARTEVQSAANKGQHEGYRQAGAEEEEWVSSGDADVRDSHVDMDGEVKKIDAVFSNGLEHPGDPGGSPEEIINCRCTIAPVVE